MGGSTKSVYTWQKLYSQPAKVIQDVEAQADEIGRLMRDLARVTDARGSLERRLHNLPGVRYEPAAGLWAIPKVTYGFSAAHRLIFAVRVMYRILAVHPSGFSAWLRALLSPCAVKDQRHLPSLCGLDENRTNIPATMINVMPMMVQPPGTSPKNA
jgi:hypothetical protein